MRYPRLVIVDLETTGADPNRDRITEIAILITEGDQLIEQWSSLVNPGMHIPSRIQELIGISDEMVAELHRRVDDGERKAVIARDLGISRETLYQYLRAAT